MLQTGHWKKEDKLERGSLLKLVKEKLERVDIDKAMRDVRPFIKDRQELALWSREFSLGIIDSIEII